MKLILTDGEHLNIKHIYSSELLNIWLKNFYDKEIVNIKYVDNSIKLLSNKRYKLIKNLTEKETFYTDTILENNKKYYLFDIEESKILNIYTQDDIDENYLELEIEEGLEDISLSGKYFVDADLTINDAIYDYGQIKFKKNLNNYEISTKDFPFDIYNGYNILKNNTVKYGDYLFIDGFNITLIDKKIYIYYHNNKISLSKSTINNKERINNNYEEYITNDTDVEISSLVNFKRVPKIQRKIIRKVFAIDPPSSQELKESMPAIYTMLPMLLMSMTSIISGVNVINDISMGNKTLEESMPGLIVTGCMILAMVMYPIISNVYKKRRERKRELTRIDEYKDYIYEQKRKITEEMEFQKNVLNDNFYSTEKSKEIIENLNNNLWERKRGTEDFLTLALGIGDLTPNIEIKIPEEHFTIDRDKLRIQLVKLEEETEKIKDVPITFDFYENNVVSFIGKNELTLKYIESFLIRLFASITYDDVKIVIFTNKNNKSFWKQYIDLPYLWNDEKTIRFFGDDQASYSRIINYLDEEYRNRASVLSNKDETKKVSDFSNYMIFVDDISKIKNIPVLNQIIKNQYNFGFTVIFNTTKMDLLPSECKNFIYINNEESKLISNKDKNYFEETFVPDIIDTDYTLCYQNLSNVYLDSFEKKFILPTKLGFLEMYGVGNINDLNILGKWNNNSIIDSISVPIGIDDGGDIVDLNLHENAHGPHGLVAGMTGSGKSELLITYILSLAVNYNPQEVQFVLIDYKGGGLANTFYNSNIGMILPHVVGVITNINENEINRSLISLQSEIKRRQKVFAEVSIKYNEGNMDIYKYENIYKSHDDVECLSHLFIISDEFAELKTQNPEFINQLISIARIGRSLGIHLILATQKPSGVVDDQIWSNSRFKICLKVQDKSDSNDMIKVPDAAMLKESGRFYLQVGFNELFMKGQSAYSGVEYIEKDDINKITDDKIDFMNSYGKKYFKVARVEEQLKESKGKEINNIVKSIIELAHSQNYNIRGLWRELIPEKIYVNELIQKYKFEKNEFRTCAIGEYDAPNLQTKGLATINLVGEGNIVIYGIIGSGKEMLLQTILYSLISNYLPEELNIYIMDYGAEILGNFRNAPQVGDIIYITDKEKIFNSFKFLNKMIEERKKLLTNYNGDFITYNRKADKKLPVILFIVNILENLFENYEDLSEDFLQLTRECNRYGISFLITTNGTTNIRTKLLQGFKKSIALELKDKYDYTNIFGNKVTTKPTKYKGRGYINVGDIYEFQTAYLSSEKENNDAIEEKCRELVSVIKTKAQPIPILPEVVSYNLMKRYLTNNSHLPIGVNVDNLTINKFEFVSKRGVLITGSDLDMLMNFYQSLEKNILSFSNNKIFVFNAYKKFENINKISLIDNEYESYLNQLKDFATNNDGKTLNYISFIGISDIYSKFSVTFKKEFNTILKSLNDKDNFSLIFVDNSSNLKKLEFEEFYRNNINNTRGIWIGNGISDQMTLKYGRIPREYRELVDENFGFVIDNSVVTKIKLINYTGGNNEE